MLDETRRGARALWSRRRSRFGGPVRERQSGERGGLEACEWTRDMWADLSHATSGQADLVACGGCGNREVRLVEVVAARGARRVDASDGR